MLRRFVDHVLAVAKESVKTFTHESLNNAVRLINGVSALLLAIIPGKATILEGIHGWELKPAFRGPRLPRWMQNGVSSFNEFIHELSVDSDTSSTTDYMSGEEDDDLHMAPASPSSQASHLSHTRSFTRYGWHLILNLPFFIIQKCALRKDRMVSEGNMQCHHLSGSCRGKKSFNMRDHVVHRTTDRRRGIIEDLQLAIEIFIEGMFEKFHKAAHFLLSPSQVCRALFGWPFFRETGSRESSLNDSHIVVQTATLADNNATPTNRETSFYHSLNTDARTCEDVIGELGYPYEAIRVVTDDGYVLLLERIPRRDSRKVVYLQHGVFDSSMGWVSNGVVGSPAFAAYDQGYDVFLGNLRGLVSRDHVDRNISSREYWTYSINELGTQDVPAVVEKIHEIKTSELSNLDDEEADEHRYKLCAVCHSLGGAVMLMYVITQRIEEKPHRLSRLILLSPAGFHEDSTIVFTIVQHFVLLLAPIIAPILPGLYIPTRFFRMLLNKLARDFQNYPALGGLVQTLMGHVVGGDSSNWVGVLGLPHYNMNDMPGISFHVALHLAQIKRSKKFRMYDYGSAPANMEAYGSVEPLDLGHHYDLIDIPVDLVAGQKDKVIKASMVKKHYGLLKRAGVNVSYKEFEYAHLDFTFSHREELLSYVMSRILLVDPQLKQFCSQNLRRRKIRSHIGCSNGKNDSTEPVGVDTSLDLDIGNEMERNNM